MSRRLTDFWEHVDKNGPYPDFSDVLVRIGPEFGNCWVWTGHNDKKYGKWRGKKAHRESWEMEIGSIPDGFFLDHLCRNTFCVRPNHLEPVTSGENTLRGNTFQGNNSRRDACKYGHPLDGGMLVDYSYRGRRCMTCHSWNMKVYRRQARDSQLNKQEKIVYADTLKALKALEEN